MTIRKRLTPALSTLLFLLVSVACQVVAIKIFPHVVGAPLVEDNAYILMLKKCGCPLWGWDSYTLYYAIRGTGTFGRLRYNFISFKN